MAKVPRKPRRKIVFPSLIERDYERLLEAYGEDLIKLAREKIDPKKAMTITADQLEEVLQDLTARMAKITLASTAIGSIAGKVIAHSTKQFIKVLGGKYGLKRKKSVGTERMKELRKQWVNNNTALIVTVPQRFLGGLRQTLNNGRTQALSIEQITRDLQATYDQTRYNARRIARTEVGKLHAETLLDGIKSVGATHYIWRTMGDSKVRESHRAMDGKKVPVDKPPSQTGFEHAGMAIQCRCYPEIVIEGLENE